MALLARSPAALGFTLLLTILSPILSESLVNPTSSDDEWMSSLVELLELDYEDQCVISAEAEWALLNDRKNAFEDKLEAEKAFGDFARTQAYEVKDAKNEEHEDALLKRKVQLIADAGDTLLDTDQWNKFVTFYGTVRRNLESSTDYDCKVDQPKNCTFAELQNVVANSRDRHLLVSAKSSWEQKLPEDTRYAVEILPLLTNASRLNGFQSVEEYWEMLAENAGAYSRAKELWEEIEPLFIKLQKYVALRLQVTNGSMNTDGSIPVHLLGSLLGNDWSNIADVVLPYQLLHNEILKNMKEKHIGGREAFKVASRLLQTLGLNDLKENFWRDSVFDKTCPVRLVDFCQSGHVQAFTCNEITLANFLDAHEAAMNVKHKEMSTMKMANTHIIREANRYSALNEALEGLTSLLAITPNQLERSGILPLKVYQRPINQHKNAIALQLYYALRDLPRLAYYLDADLWRLKLLSENPLPTHIGSSWTYYRRNHSFVSPSERDFLGDPYIISNKPYITKFLGGVLKYQIRDALTNDLYDIDGDVVEHIALNNQKLKTVLTKALNKEWPILLDETFQISILNAEPLLDYFQSLSDFLDTELEEPGVNHDPDVDNYDNPDNNDNDDEENEDNDLDIEKGGADDVPKENIIEHEPELQQIEQIKKGVSASSIDTLAKEATPRDESTVSSVKNAYLIPKEAPERDPKTLSQSNENGAEEVQQSSALNYAWIALGVVLAIVLVLVVVIARKRYNHRKDLERQRREGAAA